jgi:SAM-dependent methyltransferase
MKKVYCPSCDSNDTYSFYEIDEIPIYSTTILNNKKEALAFPTGNIMLFFCRDCGFIFNAKFESDLLDYSISYEDQQGFSGTFSNYIREQADYLIKKYNLYNKSVLEIGSGKGDFLLLLRKLGKMTGIGIDPAFTGNRIEEDITGLKFIKDFYTNQYTNIKSDLICCRHTLEHIPNVFSFMNNVRTSAENNPNTIVFFEVPDVDRILNNFAFWDIYYEHCSYFSTRSFSTLFNLNKLNVLNIKKVYNDQYITIEAKPYFDDHITDIKQKKEIYGEELVSKFVNKIKQKISRWKKLLHEYQDNEIIIWGSGSKCVSFIKTLKIGNKIKSVIDINPYRHGYYLPSTGQQIVEPEFLIDNKPELLLIMNSIYEKEIKHMMNEMGVYTKILSLI